MEEELVAGGEGAMRPRDQLSILVRGGCCLVASQPRIATSRASS